MATPSKAEIKSTKNEICTMVEELCLEDRMKVLKHLMDGKVKISEHGDGSRINLDILSDTQIADLHFCVVELFTAYEKNIVNEYSF